MSSQEKSFERINQKRRTRAELLRAARELTERGMQPSVADVAEHAGISKATAYRYFSTPEDMIREAVLDAVATVVDPGRAIAVGPEPEKRLDDLIGQIFDMVASDEATFRALLASTVMGKSGTRRGGRRVGWLTQVLEPLQAELPPEEFRRLVQGLSLVAGIETLVVLKDVCDVETAEARKAALWAARAMLEGALARHRKKGA